MSIEKTITAELNHSCLVIEKLFETMHGENASNWQIRMVSTFRRNYPELNDDLDFCFEVLAGMHKVGFTVNYTKGGYNVVYQKAKSIKEVYNIMASLTAYDKADYTLSIVSNGLPDDYADFFMKLFNREYKLGYSNRKNMVTNLHCMLANKYPDGVKTTKDYYIQEKLNGNRCIAWFDTKQDKWRFTSRSQKEKSYPFDMSKLDKEYIYDGEVMSRNAMGNRDFAKTSGLANSKYGDKRELVYIIYDILDDSLPYEERWYTLTTFLPNLDATILDDRRLVFENTAISDSVAILPCLAKITVSSDPTDNYELDKLLDTIVDAGGEGIMLRDPEAPYHHSAGSGNRKNYLLKYKKLKTGDLRIIGWNNGKGKYEGYIGSFICEDDEHTIKVNVSGMDDSVRVSDPYQWIGKIIEVAYFEVSSSKAKTTDSLQFARYVRTRHDKDETSMF